MPRKLKIQKKKPIMYGRRMNNPAGVTVRYKMKLSKLTKRMVKEVTREIEKLFRSSASKEYVTKQKSALAMDESISSQARILLNQLSKKFDKLFNEKAWSYAEEMVEQSAKVSKFAVQESIKTLSGGVSLKIDYTTGPLKEILKSTTFESVSLIKSIPQKYMTEVQGDVMRAISGGGVGELYESVLKKPLEKLGGSVEKRAKFIAEDQTRKTYNAITAQRIIGVGVKKFEWLHSGGGLKPRQEHIDMNAKVFSYDKLPVIDSRTGETGLPGQLPNCRCVQRPVFEFDDEDETL